MNDLEMLGKKITDFYSKLWSPLDFNTQITEVIIPMIIDSGFEICFTFKDSRQPICFDLNSVSEYRIDILNDNIYFKSGNLKVNINYNDVINILVITDDTMPYSSEFQMELFGLLEMLLNNVVTNNFKVIKKHKPRAELTLVK